MSEHKQFETNGITVLAVPVPQQAKDPGIINSTLILHWLTSPNKPFDRVSNKVNYFYFELPEGDWTIHAVTRTTKYEDDYNGGVVDRAKCGHSIIFWDYENEEWFDESMGEADSMDSLLRTHGIDPKQKNILLIKGK